MLKQNKLKLIISSVLIILPSIVLYFLKDIINDKNSLADFFAFPVFLSLFLLVLFWICILITFYDNKHTEQNQKVMNIVFWIMPSISFFVSLVLLLSSMGSDKYLANIMSAFLGIVFIVIGNYLPKCKQNHTVGIRIKWTLANEENWNKTHRFSGFVYTACGIVLIILSFITEKVIFIAFPIIVFLSCIASALYSYLFYKKQIREGKNTKEDFVLKPSKKKNVFSAIII